MGFLRNCYIFYSIFLLILNFWETHCTSINDTNVLLHNLLNEYNKNVRPVENHKRAVNVNVSLLLNSIHELDAIRGIFSIMGIMKMQWHDPSMVWDPAEYGGVDFVMTSYKEVWVPELILINPAEESDTIGKNWQRVYFHNTGFAAWSPGDLIKGTCTINVHRYPFDTQECTLSFSAWGYHSGHIQLNALRDKILQRHYTESSTWTLTNSHVRTSSRGMQIDFTVYLKRNSEFVIVNVLLPLTFLSILNAFVFLLLPESGERISYCITVLLAIAVFMTIVSDTLPKSSKPVPIISFKLMVDMITSTLMTLVTILNLRLYYRTDEKDVPYWLKQLYIILCCKRTKCGIHPISTEVVDNKTTQKMFADEDWTIDSKGSIYNKSYNKSALTADLSVSSVSLLNKGDSSVEPKESTLVRMISKVERNCTCNAEVSWKNISSMADGISFVVFTLMSVCSLIVYIVLTY